MTDADELEMPPCEALYLVGYLFEVGPTVAAGMGDGPLSHVEIDAFQRNTGIELTAWEARTLRRLSQDYAAQSHKSLARDCPPPWEAAPYSKPMSSLAAERTRNALRALSTL